MENNSVNNVSNHPSKVNLYSIRNWGTLFENNRTRELKRLEWVPIPNRHDSDGYTLLMEQKNGAAIYGAWIACVQVASKCDPRGTLLRDGGRPHDVDSLSRITRIPASIIKEMLTLLSGPDLGWLEIKHLEQDCGNPAPSCGEIATGCPEWKGREENGMNGMEVVRAGKLPATSKLSDSQWFDSLKANPAYQGLNIEIEYGKMCAWCETRNRKPTRRSFVNWLNRAEKPMSAPARNQGMLIPPVGKFTPEDNEKPF